MVVMVMMASAAGLHLAAATLHLAATADILQVLLKSGKSALGPGQVARLQCLSDRIEVLI